MRGRTELDHIDESFINESWQVLSDRLDQEIPVVNTQNNKATKYLIALLLLCLSGLLYMSYLYFSTVPVSPATRYAVQNYTHYVESNLNPAPRIKTQNDVNAVLNVANASIPTRKSEANNSKMNTVNDWFYQGFQLSNMDLVALGCESGKKQNLEVLPAIDDKLDDVYRIMKSPTLVEKIEIHRSHKLPSLYFSLSTFISNIDYSGYGVGLGFQFPVQSRLAFETGIHLNYISRDYFIFPFLELDQSQSFKALSNPNLQDADTYFSGLKGFKQLVLPLGLIYSAGNKVSINTGLRFRYTYAETIDQEFEIKAQKKIDRNQSVAETFFNHSNLGIYSGVAYNVTDHFSLRLDAEFGLSSLVSNTAISDPYFRPYDLNLLNLSAYFKF